MNNGGVEYNKSVNKINIFSSQFYCSSNNIEEFVEINNLFVFMLCSLFDEISM